MKRGTVILLFIAVLFARSDDVFRFIVVGDRTGGAVEHIFDEVIDEVKLFAPDFVINVGDIIEGYTDDTFQIHAEWDTIMRIVKTLPCTFYFVAGNHDIQNETEREIFKNRTGFKRYYSFDHGNSHFIVLDNTMAYWSQPEEMSEEQLTWLHQDLEKNKKAENIFVFYHIPTYLYALREGNTDPLMELFVEYPVRFVFTGHHHEYSYINRDNIEYINVGSSGGGMGTNDRSRGHFYHYLLVTVDGKESEVAVIEKGNVFLRNVVTADDLLAIQQADAEAVRMEPCVVQDKAKKVTETVAMTVTNFGPDSLLNTLMWQYDSSRYSIRPAEQLLQIPSDEQGDYAVTLIIHNGSEIFPLPRYTLEYPFTYGKVCTLRNFLPVKRLKNVAKCKVAPILDGKLSDKAWDKIDPITQLATYDGLPEPPVERTELYVCHDEENIYMAARCFESDFAQMRAEETEQDGRSPWDDNLWLFLDSNRDHETYYQAIINSNGAVFDRECSIREGDSYRNIMWNGPWEITTGREENAWILEIKIPKKGFEPFNDDQWGFNFRRLQPRSGFGDAGYWSLPFGHDPENFGILQFE